VLALLNDKARPVATLPAGENGRDWRRPFVASEIGEALPHWEAALYLMRPEQLQESARDVRRTLVLLIAAALARTGRAPNRARRAAKSGAPSSPNTTISPSRITSGRPAAAARISGNSASQPRPRRVRNAGARSMTRNCPRAHRV